MWSPRAEAQKVEAQKVEAQKAEAQEVEASGGRRCASVRTPYDLVAQGRLENIGLFFL